MKTIAVEAQGEQIPQSESILFWLGIIVLAAIFLDAGFNKWTAPADFEASLIRQELFPDWMINPAVSSIPTIEIAFSLACLFPSLAIRGIQGLLTLTILYTFFLTLQWQRGIQVGCGCFGTGSAAWPYWMLIARNLGLLTFEACLLRQALLRRVSQSNKAVQIGRYLN